MQGGVVRLGTSVPFNWGKPSPRIWSKVAADLGLLLDLAAIQYNQSVIACQDGVLEKFSSVLHETDLLIKLAQPVMMDVHHACAIRGAMQLNNLTMRGGPQRPTGGPMANDSKGGLS